MTLFAVQFTKQEAFGHARAFTVGVSMFPGRYAFRTSSPANTESIRNRGILQSRGDKYYHHPTERPDMELISVAAVADNGVIGQDDGLPWESIPADRRQYRARVAEHPVILGRRTFDSMRDDLPGTTQIVLSRTPQETSVETGEYVTSVTEALSAARALETDRAYVLGGAAIYGLFQPHITQMVLSRVPGAYEGDAVFPEWDRDVWTLQEQTRADGFTLEHWVRTR